MMKSLLRGLLGMVLGMVLSGTVAQAQLTRQLPSTPAPAPAPELKPTTLPRYGLTPESRVLAGLLTETWRTGPILDLTRFPEERILVQRMRSSFPNLGENFEVQAPRTGHADEPTMTLSGKKRYNCIAWTVGITEYWVWPGKGVKDFDQFYSRHGLKRASNRDLKLEPGIDKVALYAVINSSGELVATHAARQEVDGTWTSKLGGEARIRHLTPEAVAGPAYGDPVAVYTRRR